MFVFFLKKKTYENFDLINLLITLAVALKFYYLWLTSSSITETSILNGMWRTLFDKVGLNSKTGS